jgi:hypothetical protein
MQVQVAVPDPNLGFKKEMCASVLAIALFFATMRRAFPGT